MKKKGVFFVLLLGALLTVTDVSVQAHVLEGTGYQNSAVQRSAETEETFQADTSNETNSEVYVSFSSTQAAKGSGTEADPYNYFADALEAVAEGGTIMLGKGGGYIATEQGNELKPFLIDKKVTIKAGAGSVLSVRRAGIVLGADVTFEDVTLSFANREKSAVCANGHTLTLTNVSQVDGTRTVHLFAGGLYDLDGDSQEYDYKENAGTHGKIIINGTKAEFGNIYAGAMNMSSSLPATITVNGVPNMEIGDIYACGALKGTYDSSDLFSGAEPADPGANAENFPVSGKVIIQLNNSNVTKVFGKTGGSENALVEVSTSNLNEYINLDQIASLSVMQGHVKPAALNENVDVQIKEGGILDLSAVAGANNHVFKVNDFAGGGILRLGQSDTLTINGTITGRTEFQTTSSQHVGYEESDIIIADHIYIRTSEETNNDAFTFVANSNQNNALLEMEQGNWVAKLGKHQCEDSSDTFDNILPLSGEVEAGSYYLSDYYEEAQTDICIKGNVNLCLNGSMLDMGEYTLYVEDTLNITNCYDRDAGAVIGSKNIIVINPDKQLSLKNCTLDKNDDDGGIVRNFGTLNNQESDILLPVWNYGTFSGNTLNSDDSDIELTESVGITFNLSNCTADNNSESVSIKSDYECTLLPTDEYQLPESVRISIAGNVMEGEMITYNHNTGKIVIQASAITGDIIIEAEAAKIHTHTGGTATCVSQAKCSDCGQPYGGLNSSNHIGGTEIRDAVEATAAQEGYTGDEYCSGCHVKIKSGTKIPALGTGEDDDIREEDNSQEDNSQEDNSQEDNGQNNDNGQEDSDQNNDNSQEDNDQNNDNSQEDNDQNNDNSQKDNDQNNDNGQEDSDQENNSNQGNDNNQNVENNPGNYKSPFKDVAQNKWYYDAVNYVYKNKLMNGYNAEKFAPEDNLSRAMLVQVLYNREGRPAVKGSNPFMDVSANKWYADAVIWATTNGIVNGYSESSFGPDDNITREQMAVILYRYASYEGYDCSGRVDLTVFTDCDEVSGWAKEMMEWAVASGLMQGKGNNKLVPKGMATRAEVAKVLMNFCEKIAE